MMLLSIFYPVASLRISQAIKTAVAEDRFAHMWVLFHAVLMELCGYLKQLLRCFIILWNSKMSSKVKIIAQ